MPDDMDNEIQTVYPDGNYLTEKGRTLIAKLLATKGSLNYTRATVGTGGIPEDKSPEEMEDLTQYMKDGYIAFIGNPDDGEVEVVVQVFSAGVTVGFSATQIILWADDPDDGEIAYSLLWLGGQPEWIRPQTDPVQKVASFSMQVTVSSLQPVNATLNPRALARAIDLMNHIESPVMTEEGVHGMRFWEANLQVWDGEKWITIGGAPEPIGQWSIQGGTLENTAAFGTITPNDTANTLEFDPGFAERFGSSIKLI